MTAGRQHRAAGLWIAIGVLALGLLTAGGSMTTTDAVVAYDVTRGIVERHTVATSGDLIGNSAYRGRDGRYYSPFGIAQSIWNIPFFLAGRTIALRTPQLRESSETISKAAVALGTIPAVALLSWVGFELLIALGATPSRAAATALLLIVATPLWPYSRFGFNQPLTALFLWAAILAAIAGRQRSPISRVAAGMLIGFAVLTRHEMVAAAAVLGLFVMLAAPSRRMTSGGWYAAGLLPPLAAWAFLNWWRFGSAFDSGYLRDPTPGFGSSVLEGISGFLFGPYASIFLYCPLVVLSLAGLRALYRRHPAVAALFAVLAGGYLVLYASLGNWMGGRSYGPRYLVPLLPALVLPLAFWWPENRAQHDRRDRHDGHHPSKTRTAAVMIALLSVLVQLPGVFVDYSKVRMTAAAAGLTVAQDTRWSGAPLLLNARATLATAPTVFAHLTGFQPMPRIPLSDLSASHSTIGFDFWWLHLLYAGVLNRSAALVIVIGLFSLAIGAMTRALVVARQLS